MNVYQAAQEAEKWVKLNTAENVQSANGVIGLYGGQILKFNSIYQARSLGAEGYIFSYLYKNGTVTLTPEN